LAAQSEDPELAATFSGLAKALAEAEEPIVNELGAVQGASVDLGGYYRPDPDRAAEMMRPSPTFNAIVESLEPSVSAGSAARP
ncbi:MAG: NADP-dependent isocitrate dehydrogenase, partial [Acidimicrobiales bacterium]